MYKRRSVKEGIRGSTLFMENILLFQSSCKHFKILKFFCRGTHITTKNDNFIVVNSTEFYSCVNLLNAKQNFTWFVRSCELAQ